MFYLSHRSLNTSSSFKSVRQLHLGVLLTRISSSPLPRKGATIRHRHQGPHTFKNPGSSAVTPQSASTALIKDESTLPKYQKGQASPPRYTGPSTTLNSNPTSSRNMEYWKDRRPRPAVRDADDVYMPNYTNGSRPTDRRWGHDKRDRDGDHDRYDRRYDIEPARDRNGHFGRWPNRDRNGPSEKTPYQDLASSLSHPPSNLPVSHGLPVASSDRWMTDRTLGGLEDVPEHTRADRSKARDFRFDSNQASRERPSGQRSNTRAFSSNPSGREQTWPSQAQDGAQGPKATYSRHKPDSHNQSKYPKPALRSQQQKTQHQEPQNRQEVGQVGEAPRRQVQVFSESVGPSGSEDRRRQPQVGQNTRKDRGRKAPHRDANSNPNGDRFESQGREREIPYAPRPNTGGHDTRSRSPLVNEVAQQNIRKLKYDPLRESAYVPLNLVHPFRRYPNETAFDISSAVNAPVATDRKPNKTYFECAADPACSYTSRDEESKADPAYQRKLLVMDLNGALLVRSKHSYAAKRTAHPRPFLRSLLEWLMLSPCHHLKKHHLENKSLNGLGQPVNGRSKASPKIKDNLFRPFEAFVWSSAQPDNVASMVNAAFQEFALPVQPGTQEADKGHIIGIWNRSHMDLTKEQYRQKSLTYKDLRKIFKAYEDPDKLPQGLLAPNPVFIPDVFNTILLDDSLVKSALQPFNHLPITEYSLESRATTNARIKKLISEEPNVFGQARTRTFDDSKADLEAAVAERVLVMQIAFGNKSEKFYKTFIEPFVGTEPAPFDLQTDVILLGVVGILSELSDVQNVPAWFAAGGLMPNIHHTFTEVEANNGWENMVRSDLGMNDQGVRKLPRVEALQHLMNPSDHRVPPILPSSPDYLQWYQSPAHVLYWIRRGLIALDERGVAVDFGEAVNGGAPVRDVREEAVDDEVS